MNLQLLKLSPTAIIPSKADPWSAGYDIYADEHKIIPPNTRALIKTGLTMAIPDGYYGRIAPRSGLALKYGIDVLAGVIDSSYRGEIGVILYNTWSEDFCIESGMRIAQMIIESCHSVTFQERTSLDETERGEGKFGSTGV